MKPIPIYVLAWHRMDMTETCLRLLHERTRYPHEVHLWVNSAWEDDIGYLLALDSLYDSIHLDKRNTCVWYPKGVQHMMTPADTPYYVLNDQDYYPPMLDGQCWLERMVAMMDKYTSLGCLAAQVPPQVLQMPIEVLPDIVTCRAVGNSLRITRRSAWPQAEFTQRLGGFGDDSILCKMMRDAGFHTAFMRGVYGLHAGQCHNWGYKESEIGMDPRKAGYGTPFKYDYDPLTYVPTHPELRM